MMKQSRFTSVVAKAGRPAVYLVWGPSAKDAGLQRALRGVRVMTLHLETRGSKAGYGHVGLPAKNERHELLIFPRSLKRFAGDRIVGIDYQLIDSDLGAEPGRDDRRQIKRALVGSEVTPPETQMPLGNKAGPGQRRVSKPPTAIARSGVAPRVGKTAPGSVHGSMPTKAPRPSVAPANLGPLVRAVREAMSDLEKDHPMAAYRRLKAASAAYSV